MKNCLHCKYANWKRNAAGNLHPSGDGACDFPYKVPPLPASMYWIGFTNLSPSGGYINRKKELKQDCIYYQREAI